MSDTITPESVLDLAAATALGQNYVLRVRGNSMAAEHILDGDHLVVSTRPAQDGDMVVAQIDGLAVVGTLSRDALGRQMVESREPLMPPLYLIPGVDQVQGVVLAIIRRFGR
jgi:SOS-response transcriptional repressor LexA